MATEEMSLLTPTSTTATAVNRRHDKGEALNPTQQQVLYRHGENAAAVQRFPPFHHHSGDPSVKTTRELTTGFIDDSHRYFQPQQPPEFRHPFYATPVYAWNVNEPPSGVHGSDGDEDEDDEDEDDDDDDDDDDDEELNEGDGELNINNNNSSNSRDKILDNRKSMHLSSFGSNRGIFVKERNVGASGDDSSNNNNNMNNNNNDGAISCENGASQFQNGVVTIADPNGNLYYQQPYLQGQEGLTSVAHKDVSLVENGCGFSGRKDATYLTEPGESLRKILSDPISGSLMDDAMILPCGYSFGGGGVQHVIRMKACYTCSQLVSEDSVATNFSLRAAVQAFRREEEMQVNRASKRRREKFEQGKSNYGDLSLLDHPRSKGVQFPFSVTDRVIIKGNKRTPQRFVGREAVVTTQCLNGWYVVKTLDNAESVKLQYRSLAKVSDNIAIKQLSNEAAPNWL